jgi:protein-tyrosine phosphatase
MTRGRETTARQATKTVLFLCTGNYYRSRFAEELFNHLAAGAGLEWYAVSRGIALELGLHNIGPMSPHARRGLEGQGITVQGSGRFPAPLIKEELEMADRVIALKEAEHRPLLLARFPGWAERVEYWQIDDLEDTPPGQALPEMEVNVRRLVQRLSADGHGGETK